MDLGARGEELARRTVEAVDALLTAQAAVLLNATAAARRVSPHHLALCVPGVCHTHGPDDRPRVPGCAFCTRRGNCLADR
jgi:hypothetical protein